MKKTKISRDEHLLEQISQKQHVSLSVSRGGEAVIYTRVSSLEQAQNNGSLEVQLKYTEEFCRRNNIPVAAYFGGTYESAKTDGRKEFKRMLDFVKKSKRVSFIIVYNYDRFSRTGAAAAQLSEQLRRDGIMLRSVTQDIDTSTAAGRLQENFFHMLNNFDNSAKSDRTKINTREVMMKGYWPYVTPMGYKNLKPKHRACYHEYMITDIGKEIKKGFQMLADGRFSNVTIIEKLRSKGVPVTEKNFRWIFTNSFYAGYVTGKLLEGKLVKGKHPALVNLKTFLLAQERLNGKSNVSVPKVSKHNEVPLKIFLKDDSSGISFTGYKTKGNWYYKLKKAPVPVNVRAEVVNRMFEYELAKYQVETKQRSGLENLINKHLRERLKQQYSDAARIKKAITEKQKFLEKLEEKYINDQISEAVYRKHVEKIQSEITALGKEMVKEEISGSNLKLIVSKCLDIAGNLCQTWVSTGYDNKQRLQWLIFPEGMGYNKQNHAVRTYRVNSLFEAIPLLTNVSGGNEKGHSVKNSLPSCKVPRTGFEPAHLAAPPPEDGASTNFATWAI